jgi:hypothetical protein
MIGKLWCCGVVVLVKEGSSTRRNRDGREAEE